MRQYEEYLGMKLPGKGRVLAKVRINPLETEEQLFRKYSTEVGTLYRLSGIDYEVVSSDPFQIKRLTPDTEEPFKRRKPLAEDDDDEAEEETSEKSTRAAPTESGEFPVAVAPIPEAVALVEAAPQPEVVPQVSAPSSSSKLPEVGERWRPRDPRRKASFVVKAINGDTVLTDDGRSIQLARFKRYEIVR